MTRPNRYVLGGVPEIDFVPKDQDGVFFVPGNIRLSIKAPTGDIFTVSGGDLTVASGYFYYLYRPEIVGWYEYETWIADSTAECLYLALINPSDCSRSRACCDNLPFLLSATTSNLSFNSF